MDSVADTIKRVLSDYRTIAVVGLSDHPWRDSNRVGRYMMSAGYRIIPVNPGLEQVFGLPAYPDLLAVPGPVEIVNIFRRVEHIPEIVRQAIQIRARAIWMQLGISHSQAAGEAAREGIPVIMNRCIMVEHQKLFRDL